MADRLLDQDLNLLHDNFKYFEEEKGKSHTELRDKKRQEKE